MIRVIALLVVSLSALSLGYTPFNYGPQVPGMSWFADAKFGEHRGGVRERRREGGRRECDNGGVAAWR